MWSSEPSTQDLTQQTTHTADFLGGKPEMAPQVPGLVILCHPNPERVGERALLPELLSGHPAAISRLQPLFLAPQLGATGAEPLSDLGISRRPLKLLPSPKVGGVILEPSGCPTPVRVNGEPLASRMVLSPEQVRDGVVLVLARRVALLLVHPIDPQVSGEPSYELVGESEAIAGLRREIRAAAELEVPVLLRGESGTGKELVAHALHNASRRRHRPLVAVNMGALPASLAAAELFGVVRGAFTGADRAKEGFFQRAEGGTLFLDEIGAAPLEVQVALLRALESGEIHPVGSAESRKVDVRVLAATDEDLQAASERGTFRAPLLYRLAGCEIFLPPLRQRRDDIARLFFHFLREELAAVPAPETLEAAESPWPPAALVARLVRYHWPGNVRQLRNVVRQLVMHRNSSDLAAGSRILQRLLPGSGTPAGAGGPAPVAQPEVAAVPPPGDLHASRGRFRRASEVTDEELVRTLEAHRWQLKPAAATLGVSRPTLYRLIDACGQLRKAADLAADEVQEALARCDGSVPAAAASLQVSLIGLKRRITSLGAGPEEPAILQPVGSL